MLLNRDVEKIITSYVKEHKSGAFIFNGPKGVLKLFTSELVNNLVFKDYESFIPFNHPDVYACGVYDYNLYYRFFINNVTNANKFVEFFLRFFSFVSSLRTEVELSEDAILFLREFKRTKSLNTSRIEKFLEGLEDVIEKVSKIRSVGIDVIRDVSDFVSRTSISGGKVVIISGFENATTEAQNSFLKVLEELPNNTFVVLITNELDRVLPTIRSRSFIVNFMYLKGVDIKGIFGDTFNVDEYRYYSIYNLVVDGVYDVRSRLKKLVSKGFFSSDTSSIVEVANEFSEDEILTKLFFDLSSEVLNTLLLIRGKIAGLDVEFPNEFLSLVDREKLKKYNIAKLTKLQKLLDESYYNVYVYNIDPRIVISNFLLECLST
jgi:hypothetical protein